MKAMDCCLTLVFPHAVEEEVVDFLLEHGELASGFTTVEVQGHGQGTRFRSVREQVRGRARKVKMEIVLAREDADTLVAALRARLPSPEIAYWIHPVTEFGRFA